MVWVLTCTVQNMDRRQVQLDLIHETSVRHDESIRDLEYKHLAARHHLRGELLQRQHQVELSDQREYMQRAELEQKQRHLTEAKQHPKNLKVLDSSCPQLVVAVFVSSKMWLVSDYDKSHFTAMCNCWSYVHVLVMYLFTWITEVETTKLQTGLRIATGQSPWPRAWVMA